ncbi:MAG: type II toxin-antitoxin system RelE/ParE family toxin [Bacteroidetes bacterium]|nr:type II toxin-antitoxin system RelE/ParE family toxin [Bacteroidota bacterium]MBU2586435.1 type II toxin-antitoxin system RelE/ParE family toxin [Bacteroidota bacterium]
MALEIYWSKRADKKFDKILEYLLVEWGERITGTFVKKVYDFLDILSEFPEIGTIENKEKGIRGFTIVKQINIFYKVSGYTIIILDFFDNRQDLEKKRF